MKSALNKNETLIFSYECIADALNACADFIEKNKMNYKDASELLREGAENVTAQSKVVQIREDLRIGKL